MSPGTTLLSGLAAAATLATLAVAYRCAPELAGSASPAASALDTARAAAAPMAAPPALAADTALHFAAYAPLPRPRPVHRYVGKLNGRSIVVQLSAEDASAADCWGSWYYRTGRQPHERRLVFQRQRSGQLVLLEDIPGQEPMPTP